MIHAQYITVTKFNYHAYTYRGYISTRTNEVKDLRPQASREAGHGFPILYGGGLCLHIPLGWRTVSETSINQAALAINEQPKSEQL